MLSMAASRRVWMFWRHWSLASSPRRPSASISLSSSSDSRVRERGGGGIEDTGQRQNNSHTGDKCAKLHHCPDGPEVLGLLKGGSGGMGAHGALGKGGGGGREKGKPGTGEP